MTGCKAPRRRSGARPSVFTIPPEARFLDCLASAILEGPFSTRTGSASDMLSLPAMTVLVPTRRAARMLVERMTLLSGQGALLLPRIRSLGDVDEEEAAFSPMAAEDDLDLLPAFNGLRRTLVLTRLLLEWSNKTGEHHLARTLQAGPSQALRLAESLGELIDSLETEEIPFDRLDLLADGDYPEHRRAILSFLDLVRHRLPDEMARLGVMGSAERRSRLLRAEAERLATHPPSGPVIAAGSTGSIPATAALLKTIAYLPNGTVVLPGLDTCLDEESWALLPQQHPQYGLKKLLDGIGITRADVVSLEPETSSTGCARGRFMSEVMRPGETTDRWAKSVRELSSEDLKAALQGISLVEAPTQRDEALSVALIMRAALEREGETAALITPDRSLARRVAEELERWDISIDDSGGEPLSRTPQGTFALQLLDCCMTGFAPVELLSLLKHPFAGLGYDRAMLRRLARQLEVAVLRGIRPPAGLNGLRQAMRACRADLKENGKYAHPARRRLTDKDWRALFALVDGLEERFAPLLNMFLDPGPRSLSDLAEAHAVALESLSAQDEAGAPLIWRGEAGEALSRLLSELIEAAPDGPVFLPRLFLVLIRDLLVSRVVRPRFGQHPRLAIYGLLEARLVSADTMILAGLNEGIWPSEPDDDAWLNRPMRKVIGLPAPERRIGLAAHDFAQAAAAKSVVLTWSTKINGTPAVASRWILRLKALLTMFDADRRLRPAHPWLAWAHDLDRPDIMREIAMPAPRPSLALRPRRMSVTDVENWVRDPYEIYARRILKLIPMDALAAEPGPAERGILVHAALQRFARTFPSELPEDICGAVLKAGREAFAPWRDYPDVEGLWWPQFVRMARWFATLEPQMRGGVARQLAEVSGATTIDGPGGAFELTARADRIDMFDDGSLRIIDYKTGRLPSLKQENAGFSPQLPLEAKIAMTGGFTGLEEPRIVRDLVYIRLTGGNPAGEMRDHANLDIAAIADESLAALARYIAHFDDIAQPYIPRARVEMEVDQRDFDHLSRYREWISRVRIAANGTGQHE